MFTEFDRAMMFKALELAQLGLYSTTPNPRVGCVITKDQTIVGQGWHHKAGQPHAEVLALAEAGNLAQGATAYVTLEPCNHTGRTPPCVDALIKAKVARVIAAMQDPNPLVGGEGLRRLRLAGIDVRCGLLEQQALELNLGFVSRMVRGRPWVRLKAAASIDGRTALPDGQSQWITGPAARHDGHVWRARACAILTGIGTVKADNPRLNVRNVLTERQPQKVLIDSKLQVNPAAQLFDEPGVIVIAAQADQAKQQALGERGAQVVLMPNKHGKTDLPQVLAYLASVGVNELHVEAGALLNASLIRENCVDELLFYLAPIFLGDGAPIASLPVPQGLALATRFEMISSHIIEQDVRLILRRSGWQDFHQARQSSPGDLDRIPRERANPAT
jgi:diaminohydroxyphosphoribosylaminopyrimidine deaminase / 5-amino-6-(5-phosphoribosylamino)uracil reductase